MRIDLDTFRQYVEQGLLTERAHPQADLLIWNYTQQCQFTYAWDEITLLARGLITRQDGTVVARPFGKFFNYEEYQGPIPLEPFKVTEKMDGSLGILYFIDALPSIATRGSFTSEQALKATLMLRQRYSAFPFDPAYTYLFEILYPANRIVVNYGEREDLILLAIIETATGEELDVHSQNWPFPVVKHYDGFDDIVSLRAIEEANKEGFVIRFEHGLRLKLKFSEYVRLHRLMTQVSARIIWEYVKDDKPLAPLLDRVPDEFYAWVSATRNQLLTNFSAIEQQCQAALEKVQAVPTRKEKAALILKEPYSGVIFQMLDHKNYQETIWRSLRPQAERPFKEDEL